MKIYLARQIIYCAENFVYTVGRIPLFPFKGTYSYCPECRSKFELNEYQRSGIRKNKYKEIFCSHKCQLKRNHKKYNKQIGIDNRFKISETKLKAFEGISTHYRKVMGVHEHRTIAEIKLGRKLRKGEIVHHKNGDKRDNRISNLQVMTQSEHARLHFRKKRNEK